MVYKMKDKGEWMCSAQLDIRPGKNVQPPKHDQRYTWRMQQGKCDSKSSEMS